MDKNKLMSKILIVDDNMANVLLLEKMLKISGYNNVKTLTDSRQVLDLYPLYEPDLLLLDFRMPYMDGLEVIESLNLSSIQKKSPIIMLSAESEKEYHKKALDKGAVDFITKPFNYNDIISKINNIL